MHRHPASWRQTPVTVGVAWLLDSMVTSNCSSFTEEAFLEFVSVISDSQVMFGNQRPQLGCHGPQNSRAAPQALGARAPPAPSMPWAPT